MTTSLQTIPLRWVHLLVEEKISEDIKTAKRKKDHVEFNCCLNRKKIRSF